MLRARVCVGAFVCDRKKGNGGTEEKGNYGTEKRKAMAEQKKGIAEQEKGMVEQIERKNENARR